MVSANPSDNADESVSIHVDITEKQETRSPTDGSKLVDHQLLDEELLDPNMYQGERRKLQLKNWARLIKDDEVYHEISLTQLARIKMMHDTFMENASATFNYNTLLMVASVLASLGLASNSSVIVIASMLVSPIMGPVVGMAYGTAIFDWRMVRKSMRNESISIVFCFTMGVIIAACTGWTGLADGWVNTEMKQRGDTQNFLVALPVAFFSGLGVAVGLLDDQVNSLVGVAISASLLPPACNCGLLTVAYFFVDDEKLDSASATRAHFRQAAIISLGLTLANIALIWLSSIMMFRFKEVLPIKKKVFWSDLTLARSIYRKRAFWSADSHDDNATLQAADSAEIGTNTGSTVTNARTGEKTVIFTRKEGDNTSSVSLLVPSEIGYEKSVADAVNAAARSNRNVFKKAPACKRFTFLLKRDKEEDVPIYKDDSKTKTLSAIFGLAGVGSAAKMTVEYVPDESKAGNGGEIEVEDFS